MAFQRNDNQQDALKADLHLSADCSTKATFQYRDQINGKQLRFLISEPSKDQSADIECTLRVISQDGAVSYEALSYCWGKSTSTTNITIEGHIAESRETLASALRYLRLPSSTRTSWVDTICINQNDETEKSNQVGKMDEIYSRASDVIVWLGPPSEEEKSALGMKAIDNLGSQYDGKTLNDVPK